MADQTEAITRIYEAALDDTNWASALEGIASAVEGVSAALAIIDMDGGSLNRSFEWNISERFLEDYRRDIFRNDVRIENIEKSRPHAPVFDYAFIDEIGMDRHPYYDWLAKNSDFRYFIGMKLRPRGPLSPVISVQRAGSSGHVGEQDVSVFEALGVHVAKAIEMSERLAVRNATLAAGRSWLERSPRAIFIVDAESRVVTMNERAERLASDARILTVAGGLLRGATGDFTDTIRRHVGRAVRLVEGGTLDGGQTIKAPPLDGTWRSLLSVLPLPPASTGLFSSSSYAAVIVIEPEVDRLDLTKVAQTFQLTPTEADVALSLANGRSVREISVMGDISVTTVRWHLRNLFDKTETGSQSELVSLIHRCCAIAH